MDQKFWYNSDNPNPQKIPQKPQNTLNVNVPIIFSFFSLGLDLPNHFGKRGPIKRCWKNEFRKRRFKYIHTHTCNARTHACTHTHTHTHTRRFPSTGPGAAKQGVLGLPTLPSRPSGGVRKPEPFGCIFGFLKKILFFKNFLQFLR